MNISSHNSQKLSKRGLCIAIALASAPVMAERLMLEEVIVTAQKREQSMQHVPLTVSAIPAGLIQDAGLQSLDEVQNLVPALHIYSAVNPALTSIVIRGAGTGVSAPTLEPSVGIFVDGVFMPRSIFGLGDLVDVERVEVLMGPQGTLYGKNTNAGVISVTTKGAPQALEATLEGTLGDYDLRQAKVSVASPINDEWAWRFGAIVRQRDGTFEDELTGDDDLNEIDRQSYRGQLYWTPNDALDVRAIGYYSLNDANQGEAERAFNTESAWWAYLNAVQASQSIPAPGLDDEDRKVQGTSANHSKVEVKGGSLQIDYALESGITLTSITALQNWSITENYSDVDGIAIDFLRGLNDGEEDVFTQEIRLTSPGGVKLDWLAGLYYFDSELVGGGPDKEYVYGFGFPGLNIPVGPIVLPLAAPGDYSQIEYEIDTQSWSAFGQATWNISDSTSLTFGLRYDDERKDMEMSVSAFDAAGAPWSLANAFTGIYQGGFFVPLTSGNLDDDGPTIREGDREEDNWSGMVSLNHFINDTMLYATVSTGNKSGGFNTSFGAASIEDREFDTEETTGLEIGAKFNGLLDGRARVNVALFHTVYDDFQAATFDPETVQFLVKNAGEQTTQGVDIDADLLITANLSMRVSLEYLDAEYDDYKNANCHPLSGETMVNGSCVLDGETLEFAPEWSGSISGSYVLPLSGDRELYSWAGYSFKSDHLVDPTRAPYARDVDYGLWDASIGWRNNHWDISLWGKNLTDETFTTITTANLFGTTFANPALGGDTASSLNYTRWLNDPRTWGVTLRYTY
jgi:iron complex outermembrane receptor protein